MNRFSIVIFSAVIFFSAAVVAADQNVADSARMNDFKQKHPTARFHGAQYFESEGFFERRQTSNLIYGAALATGKSPLESARNFCDEIQGIYANEVGELTPRKLPSGEVLQGVMWNRDIKTHDFFTFRFDQTLNGVPVFRSGIGFLVRSEDGFPLVQSGNNLKEMQDFEADGLKEIAAKVTVLMKRNAAAEMANSNLQVDGAQSILANERQQESPVEVSDEKLVIWAGNSNVRVAPEAAIQFVATQGTRHDFATYRKFLIVAAVDDGEVLFAETRIHADVSGTVSGQAADGVNASECESLAAFALPFAEVSITGGETVFADQNGSFNVPSNAGGTVTVNSRLGGLYFDLFDESAGGSTPVISMNVADPGSVDFLHNSAGTEFETANVNGYLHANIVRNFVLNIEPTFPVIDNELGFDIHTNINGSCGAFYDGSSINFTRGSGTCHNTSTADVVYHEYAHHLIGVTGNAQGQFGEGAADTMSVIIEDNPELAVGFFAGDCSTFLRSAENFRSYPCTTGSIHDCGQLISGCVWDTIEAIRATDPANANAIVSQLFVNMLMVRGAMGGSDIIGPEITLIFLQLDDDDGDLTNGTPHYEQIATAFNAHNMMAPELVLLNLTFPNGLPDVIDPDGGTTFQVDVETNVSPQIPNSGVLHVDTGSGFQQFPMTTIDSDSYLAEFEPTDCGEIISYFVSVDAQNGETSTQPPAAPGEGTFSAVAAQSISNIFTDDFETDQGWLVTGSATAGMWQRGIPSGDGERNDPLTDADGSGSCYVTENAPGNSDVDGGNTILTSPIMDAMTGNDEKAMVGYYRWFNSDGSVSDAFTVEISNDGGATWTTLEVVGPGGNETVGGWIKQQFIIDDFVTPTANMRFRFTAEDVGVGDIVEAGIDGVEIDRVSCDSDVLHGDVNLDGVVNLLDVAPFVSVLSSGSFQAEADINKDGVVDLLDVAPFVDLLSP